jgi:hypothetical protein
MEPGRTLHWVLFPSCRLLLSLDSICFFFRSSLFIFQVFFSPSHGTLHVPPFTSGSFSGSPQMTPWDWLVLAIGAALVFEGAWKGAIRLAFGLAGLVAGFLYAGHAADCLAGTLSCAAANLRRPLALVVGFVVILASFVLVGILMSRLAKAAGLSCLNRVAGMVLGFVVAVYLCAGMIRVADRLSPGLGERMAEGPVVRLMQSWAFGMEALVPTRPQPQPSPAPPFKAGKSAGDST